jgi:hypothetical protein
MESWSAVAVPPAAPRSPDRNGSAEPPSAATLSGASWIVAEVTAFEESPDTTGQRAVSNAHPGKPAGKCHRKQTADGAATRESRTGKGERVR